MALSTAGLMLITVLLMIAATTPPAEPEWDGRRLSEWLDIWRSNMVFPPDHGLHPPFSDAEIETALEGIGTNALPFLKMWAIQPEPDRAKRWINAQLSKMNLHQFQFEIDDTHYLSIAGNGFQYYRQDTQPLLPWLIEMSHDSDPSLRARAFSLSFFTMPEKDVFLELADRALQDKDATRGGAAAQWMVQRFPEEADRRNLRARYPEHYLHLDKEKEDTPNGPPGGRSSASQSPTQKGRANERDYDYEQD